MSITSIGQAALININLLVAQGADNAYAFRYSTTEDEVTTPVDLTGYSARSQVRKSVDADDVLLSLSEYIILGGAAGTIGIDVPAAATEDIECSSGVWDLELVAPNGAVTRFAQGRVSISREVTRD